MSDINSTAPLAIEEDSCPLPPWKRLLQKRLSAAQETLEAGKATATASGWSNSGCPDQAFSGEILTHYALQLGIIQEGEPLTYSHFTLDGSCVSTELRVFINSIELSLQKQKAMFDSLMLELTEDSDVNKDWYSQPNDMRLFTFVSKGHFRAWGFMLPPSGGGAILDQTALFNKLQEQRICFGERLTNLLGATQQGQWLKLISIAEGIEPLNGENGRVVELFNRTSNAHTSVTDDENIDFKNLNWLQNVSAGDVICNIIPPTESIDGRTVYNEEVAAKPGKSAAVPRGAHTSINEEGTALIADIEGHVTFHHNAFHVDNTLVITGNVDNLTGNLDVIGDVVVSGNIATGFSVCATGNITVRGLVEGATLKSEKDIQVALGVKGNQRGVLKASGNIICKYIESSSVTAGGNIYSESIVNSTVQCGGDIVATSGHGTIIGGIANAKKSIRAKIMGNELNRTTSINAGIEMPSVQSIEKLRTELEEMNATCQELQDKIVLITMMKSEDTALQQLLQQLTLQLSVKKMARSKLEKQLETRLEEQQNTYCVISANTIHPSTILCISGQRKKILTLLHGCRFVLKDGELVST